MAAGTDWARAVLDTARMMQVKADESPKQQFLN
jgi:hypothetical protein